MWLPILRFSRDGYGFTYGARTAVIDRIGPRSRLSVPLTWGGERRAALEAERAFDRGPFSVVRGSVALDRPRDIPTLTSRNSAARGAIQADSRAPDVGCA